MRTDRREALLVLADGTVFSGDAIGALQSGAIDVSTGELVFNTAMAGYEEVVTDPSYAGQIIAFTTPHIGGATAPIPPTPKSARPFNRGIVVRELTTRPSNWRSEESLEDFLVRFGIGGLTGVDTRRLTRHIREAGAMPCAFGTLSELELFECARAEPGTAGADLVSVVTTPSEYRVAGGPRSGRRVRLRDRRRPVLRQLARARDGRRRPGVDDRGGGARSTAGRRVSLERPGRSCGTAGNRRRDRGLARRSADIRHLSRPPEFSRCALGGRTYKLGFGHHGVNHPVRRIANDTVEITSQNHGFAVEPDAVAVGVGHARELERRRRSKVSLRATSARSRCSTTPRPAQAHTTPRICSQSLPRASTPVDLWRARADAPSQRHLLDSRNRFRSDRHRTGVRVRLLRNPGLSCPRRRGLPRRACELEPGDDHDRSRDGRPYLSRAPRPRRPGGDHHPRAPGRTTADDGRPDRSQSRDGAATVRHAVGVRRRPHRRERRGDPHGGGS